MLDGRKERDFGEKKKKENVHVTDEKGRKGSVGKNEIKVVGES